VSGCGSVSEADAERAERLEERGVIRRGAGRIDQKWLRGKPLVKTDVFAVLMRDRNESP